MARGFYPQAVQKIIKAESNDPAITPRIAILHVDANDVESLHDFFATESGGIESHFHVRKDGVVEQYRNIFRQADANLDANDFAVSIETQGLGPGTWNDVQLEEIKKLLLWLHEEADIPLVRATAWDGEGVGFHTMWGAPSHWTPVVKTCPGPERIKQFGDVIVPWMKQGPKGPRPTPRWDEIWELADAIANAEKKDGDEIADARRIQKLAARHSVAH